MTIFAIHCVDKPNSLELRMATREAHLAYVGGFREQLRLGGPMLNEGGDMAGSINLVEMETHAEAQPIAASTMPGKPPPAPMSSQSVRRSSCRREQTVSPR